MDENAIPGKRTPVYRDAGFPFRNIDEAQKAFEEEIKEPQSSGRFVYTRYGNPTVVATEEAMAKLEGGKW